jgi:crossover junction endodeoxyribonuclease RuvC
MILLGIDPGSRCTGYGLIRIERRQMALIEYGVLRLDGTQSHEWRLKHIYDRVTEVIERHLPDECAIEMPVYGSNPQSMLKLGRAQAAAMLAVLNRGLPVVQYTPKEVKRAVTGVGSAAKEQVAFMVRKLLAIGDENALDLDASDALAVALCHGHRKGERPSGHGKSWEHFVRDNPGRVVG